MSSRPLPIGLFFIYFCQFSPTPHSLFYIEIHFAPWKMFTVEDLCHKNSMLYFICSKKTDTLTRSLQRFLVAQRRGHYFNRAVSNKCLANEERGKTTSGTTRNFRKWGETISCWRFLHFSHGQHRPYFQTTVLYIFSGLSVLAKSDRQDLARFKFYVQSKIKIEGESKFWSQRSWPPCAVVLSTIQTMMTW